MLLPHRSIVFSSCNGSFRFLPPHWHTKYFQPIFWSNLILSIQWCTCSTSRKVIMDMFPSFSEARKDFPSRHQNWRIETTHTDDVDFIFHVFMMLSNCCYEKALMDPWENFHTLGRDCHGQNLYHRKISSVVILIQVGLWPHISRSKRRKKVKWRCRWFFTRNGTWCHSP